MDADELAQKLAILGVQTRPFFWPMDEQAGFPDDGPFQGETYPVAERIARKGLYLPCGLSLSEDQIAEVSDARHQAFRS